MLLLVLRRRRGDEEARGEVGRCRWHDGRVQRRAVTGGGLKVLVDRLAPVDAVVLGEDALQRPQLQPPLVSRQLMASSNTSHSRCPLSQL